MLAERIAPIRPQAAPGSASGSSGSAASTERAPAATVEPVSPSPTFASSRFSSASIATNCVQAVRSIASSAGFPLAATAWRAAAIVGRGATATGAFTPVQADGQTAPSSAAARAASTRISDSENPFMFSAVM